MLITHFAVCNPWSPLSDEPREWPGYRVSLPVPAGNPTGASVCCCRFPFKRLPGALLTLCQAVFKSAWELVSHLLPKVCKLVCWVLFTLLPARLRYFQFVSDFDHWIPQNRLHIQASASTQPHSHRLGCCSCPPSPAWDQIHSSQAISSHPRTQQTSPSLLVGACFAWSS